MVFFETCARPPTAAAVAIISSPPAEKLQKTDGDDSIPVSSEPVKRQVSQESNSSTVYLEDIENSATEILDQSYSAEPFSMEFLAAPETRSSPRRGRRKNAVPASSNATESPDNKYAELYSMEFLAPPRLTKRSSPRRSQSSRELLSATTKVVQETQESQSNIKQASMRRALSTRNFQRSETLSSPRRLIRKVSDRFLRRNNQQQSNCDIPESPAQPRENLQNGLSLRFDSDKEDVSEEFRSPFYSRSRGNASIGHITYTEESDHVQARKVMRSLSPQKRSKGLRSTTHRQTSARKMTLGDLKAPMLSQDSQQSLIRSSSRRMRKTQSSNDLFNAGTAKKEISLSSFLESVDENKSGKSRSRSPMRSLCRKLSFSSMCSKTKASEDMTTDQTEYTDRTDFQTSETVRSRSPMRSVLGKTASFRDSLRKLCATETGAVDTSTPEAAAVAVEEQKRLLERQNSSRRSVSPRRTLERQMSHTSTCSSSRSVHRQTSDRRIRSVSPRRTMRRQPSDGGRMRSASPLRRLSANMQLQQQQPVVPRKHKVVHVPDSPRKSSLSGSPARNKRVLTADMMNGAVSPIKTMNKESAFPSELPLFSSPEKTTVRKKVEIFSPETTPKSRRSSCGNGVSSSSEAPLYYSSPVKTTARKKVEIVSPRQGTPSRSRRSSCGGNDGSLSGMHMSLSEMVGEYDKIVNELQM